MRLSIVVLNKEHSEMSTISQIIFAFTKDPIVLLERTEIRIKRALSKIGEIPILGKLKETVLIFTVLIFKHKL